MPIEAIASMNSTATGMSVSCSGVSLPKKIDPGPSGMTAKVMKAGTVAMIGARRKTTLSADLGMMSSLSASFTPSASDCSRPNGPCTLGPTRCCMRATTRRSNQMLNSVSSTRITKMKHRLEGDHPPGVLTERGQTGVWQVLDHREVRDEQRGHVLTPFLTPDFTDTELPGEASSARTPRPKELAGTHTTSSGRSAISTRQGHGAAVAGDGDSAC